MSARPPRAPREQAASPPPMSRRERQRRRRRNRGSPFGRIVALGGVLALCAALVAGLSIAGWVVKVAHSAPNLSQVHPTTPGSPSEVFAADGTPMGYIYSPQVHTVVPGSELPARLKRATVAVEDRRFFQHGALDYQGIVRAAIKDALHGSTALQGASTLTMQLVDNVYLPKKYKQERTSRDFKYKIVQAKLATQLESKHSKQWILDSYLNNVPYGTVFNQTAYGVGAAARMFFDKPVQDLDLAQTALLAGLPQAPSEYNPFLDPKAAHERRAHVLAQMVRAGYISQHTADVTNRKPLEVRADKLYRTRIDPYVFDYITAQVRNDICPKTPDQCPTLTHGGMKIYTTIDLHKQAEATAAIRDNASTLEYDGGPGVGAGVASIDASNGHIEAIATSDYYHANKVDYATSASRQTGSAFKVFALMTLIHNYNGNPDETYYDSKPLEAGWYPEDPTYSVHTDDYSYHGSISIDTATYLSDNTVYAQLAADFKPGELDQTAHAMGITSKLTGNISEVLGGLTYGTTPLQMADADATLADGGIHHAPTIINTIDLQNGSTRDFGDEQGQTVFPYDETYEADTVLKKVLTTSGATGTAAYYGCPAAGKTGTAENLANAWFVGYTPKVSTAVWVGNPTGNVPMSNGFGGILAAPIWKDYMESTDGGYCGDWTAPSTPFAGTPFLGAHSTSGSANTIPSETGTDTSPSTSTYGATTPTPTTTTPAPPTDTTGAAGATTPTPAPTQTTGGGPTSGGGGLATG